MTAEVPLACLQWPRVECCRFSSAEERFTVRSMDEQCTPRMCCLLLICAWVCQLTSCCLSWMRGQAMVCTRWLRLGLHTIAPARPPSVISLLFGKHHFRSTTASKSRQTADTTDAVMWFGVLKHSTGFKGLLKSHYCNSLSGPASDSLRLGLPVPAVLT